jgi:CTP synthase (UTP-ammonia lyase)
MLEAPAVALVGDYSPEITAHRAIPLALERAGGELRAPIKWSWVATTTIRDAAGELGDFAAVWVVPGSPYRNLDGVLAVIRRARETRRPFLGTCGGFQHALIEFARSVAGLAEADHAETNPSAAVPVVAPLACALREASGSVRFTPGSLVHAAYGRDTAREGYHCGYGLNREYRARLEQAGLRFTGHDEAGEIRAAELPVAVHPFFVGTLFQPERQALAGETPPLVRAFVRAVMET